MEIADKTFMRLNGILLCVVVTACHGGEEKPRSNLVLKNVIETIGGEEKLKSLEGVRYRTSGYVNADDEGYSPQQFLQKVTEFEDTISHDTGNNFFRIDSRLRLHFEGLEGSILTYKEVLHPDAGSRSDGSLPFDPGTAEHYPVYPAYLGAMHRQMKLLNPHLFLLQGLTTQGSVISSDPEVIDGQSHEGLLIKDNIQDVILYVNPGTWEIKQLETLEYSKFRRDVPVRVEYGNWNRINGVSFPLSVSMYYDNDLIREASRSDLEVNPVFDAGFFDLAEIDTSAFDREAIAEGARQRQLPVTFRSMGIDLFFLQSYPVQSTEVMKGVYYLGGGGFGSLVVEQSNHLILLEAPVGEERTLSILEWVKSRFKGKKPIKYLVPTHHHQDHAAGVRTVMAHGGVSLVVASSVTDFWVNRILSAPSTVKPDLLALHPPETQPGIIGITKGSPVTIGDVRPVTVHRVASAHAEDMVMAVITVGTDTTVFQGDLYNLGTGTLVVNGPADFIGKLQELDLIDDTTCQVAGGATLTVTAVHAMVPSEPVKSTIRFLLGKGADIPCQNQ